MTDLTLAFRSLRATPVVSGGRGALAGARHRRQHRDLLAREQPAPARPAGQGAGTARARHRRPGARHQRRGPIRSGNRSATAAICSTARSRGAPSRFNLASGGETQFVDGIWASGRLFETLGVPAMLGRTFTEADDARGGGPDGPVAVISYGFWQRRFGGAVGCDRQAARSRQGPLHDHRRHRTRFLRTRCRPRLRRRGTDRHRADLPRQGVVARSAIVVVAHGDGAAEAGTIDRCRHRGHPQPGAADPRGHAARLGRRHEGLPQGEIHAGAGGHRQLAVAPPLPTPALDAPRRRRPRAADRVRQHRQSAARARDGAAPRVERPPRARRVAVAARAAAAHRKPAALRQRRGARTCRRTLGQPAARPSVVHADEHRVPGSLARLAGPRVHERGDGR